MSIDTYANVVIYFNLGVFLLSVAVGIVVLIYCIWKRKVVRYWWVIPVTAGYSLFAQYNVFVPYIAYDDLADPNYLTFKDWGLRDFVYNDIRMLAAWLFVGVVFFLLLERNRLKKMQTTRLAAILGAISFVVLAALLSVYLRAEMFMM